ncbi:MAG: c-type cytochrome [Candidatus Rokubacteria bacterium]|nr:c-type cytochrome [Candidatus Rokubacteria bacterium]
MRHAFTGLTVLTVVGLAALAWAQQAPAPRRYTMEELHRSGGVPRGWKFTLPAGDAAKGRGLFRELECYKCHAIKDGGFPPVGGDAKSAGPELTGMGANHPAEYFAESILAPNAVLVDGPGFVGPDGRSIMPGFADSLGVTQLVDLVAFLKSLTGAEGHAHGAAAMEGTAGDYVVRLAYAAPGAGHLMVFVSDATTGEPVPYLPVTVTLRGEGLKPRTVRLAPMVGAQGFHYGASVAVADETETATIAIGRTTMRVMPSAKGRFVRPVTIRLDWSP